MTRDAPICYAERGHHNLPQPNINRLHIGTHRFLNLSPFFQKVFLNGGNHEQHQHASA
jgi:hypothetical protein